MYFDFSLSSGKLIAQCSVFALIFLFHGKCLNQKQNTTNAVIAILYFGDLDQVS